MKKSEIGIDGYNLAMPNGTGVKTYAANLTTVLQKAGNPVAGLFGIDPGRDPDLVETLFFDRLGRPEPEISVKARRRRAFRRNLLARLPWRTARPIEIPLTERVDKAPLADRMPAFDRMMSSPHLFDHAHRYFGVHGRLMPVRLDRPPAIMHWTYPVPLRMIGAHNIYTIHDVVPLKLPYTTLDNKARYRALLRQCESQAAAICTVSEQSRSDLQLEFGWEASRIVNTYQCVCLPAGFLDGDPQGDAAVIKATFGLDHRAYFLYFAAIEPKKNVARMIEAFLALDTQTPLVIVSGRDWQSEAETSLLAAPYGDLVEIKRLAARVIRTDHLSRLLLLRLIRGAKAVLFPSLYEGFGLPVLEAMQLGTPVLTSTAGALPEIAGDGALLVDPYDVPAISNGIRALDEDAALRQRLSAAASQRATCFAEDAYATRLEALYRYVLDRSDRRDAS